MERNADSPTWEWEDLEITEEDELMFQAAETTEDVRSAKHPLAVCHKCRRSLNSIDGYRNHLKMHLIEELLKCAPNEETFKTECHLLARSIFEKLASREDNIGLSEHAISIASKLLFMESARNFVDSVATELWQCIPSSAISLASFHSNFVKATHVLMGNMKKRDELVNCVKDIVGSDYSVDAFSWFVGSFVFKLSLEAEAFYFNHLKEPFKEHHFKPESSESGTVRDSVDSEQFQQSLYYVGGSVVRSVLQLGKRNTSSSTWRSIVNFVTTKMLKQEDGMDEDTEAEPGNSNASAWTEAVNRGRLKFITEATWEFFMGLSMILSKVEEKDGSILHDKVKEVLIEDPLLILWREIVQDTLSDEDSEFLCSHLCTAFTNAWGRGVTLRRKNIIFNQSRDKIPLRPSLLPRK